MVKRTKEKGFKMPYLLDEKSSLANAFGAKTTPHVFLFDHNMKLVYRGAIDDNVNSASAVKTKYLENAMNALSAGKTIEVNDTRPVGCSIKRS
jgi:thioredoxin-related protein